MNLKATGPRHRHGSKPSLPLRSKRKHARTKPLGNFERLEPRIAMTAGDLDPSFGNNGYAVTTFGQNAGGTVFGEARVAIQQQDGKLLVAGNAGNAAGTDFGLARFLANGDLDTSFGVNGVVRPETLGYYGWIDGIEQLADGTIIAVGMRAPDSPSTYTAISFYTADGTFIRQMNPALTFSMADSESGVTFQPDGKIIIAGSSGATAGFFLTRLNTDGSVDTTFNGGQPVDFDIPGIRFGGGPMAVQPDGKIVVGGAVLQGNDFEAAIARFNANGSIDTTFGGGGVGYRIEPDLSGGAQNVLLEADGKIVVVGSDVGQPVWAVRYNADGTPDNSFHADPASLNLSGNGGDRAPRAVLAPDGQLYVSGWIGIDRLNADGSLDTTFGTHGSIHPVAFPVGLLLDSSGRLLVVGATLANPNTNTPAGLGLVGYQAEGAAPVSGTLTIPAASKSDRIEVTFSSATEYTVSINGISTPYTTGRVDEIIYQGAGTFLVSNPFTDAKATLSPGALDYAVEDFHIAVSGAAAVYVSGTSASTAVLLDSQGADKFVGTHTYASLSGNGFYEYVGGFDTVTAKSSSAGDVAHFYAGPGDVLVATPKYSTLSIPGFERTVTGFDKVYAHGTHGNHNTAFLNLPGNGSKLVGTSSYSSMSSNSYFVEAIGFDRTNAYSGESKDVAWLYARGDENFVGKPSIAYLTSPTGVYAYNFHSVRGVAATAANRAFLYDSRGDDTFTATPTSSKLVGDGFANEAIGFHQVNAIASGGFDTAIFVGLPADGRFYASPTGAYETATGHLNKAVGFDRIVANAGGMHGSAFLTDSAGNDRITGSQASLTLKSPKATIVVNGYQRVQAKHTGGTDTQHLQAVDFAYKSIGNWHTI